MKKILKLLFKCWLICLICSVAYALLFSPYWGGLFSSSNAEDQLMQYKIHGKELKTVLKDNPNISSVKFRLTKEQGGRLWIFSFDVKSIGTIRITGFDNPQVGSDPRFINAYIGDVEVPVMRILESLEMHDINDMKAVILRRR